MTPPSIVIHFQTSPAPRRENMKISQDKSKIQNAYLLNKEFQQSRFIFSFVVKRSLKPTSQTICLKKCRKVLDPSRRACYRQHVFRRSSAVEQLTVNQLVVGSIPTAGAKNSRKYLIQNHNTCAEFGVPPKDPPKNLQRNSNETIGILLSSG